MSALPTPTAFAEATGALNMESRLSRPGETFWEKNLASNPRLQWLYKMLYVLGIPYLSPAWAHKMKYAMQKGANNILKEYLTEIELMSAEAKIFGEEIKHGQVVGRVNAFVGFTEGSVKELGNLTHHAYLAENAPIRGVYMNRKELTTHLMTMEPTWDAEKQEWKCTDTAEAATYGQLAEMYNTYFKEFGNDDGIRRLKKMTDPKMTDKELADISVGDEDYKKFGFHKGVAREIDTQKEEMNLTDLYCMGRFLFADTGKDSGDPAGRDLVAAKLRDQNPELYAKIFTYKDSHGNIQELTQANEMAEKWVHITGFTTSSDKNPVKMMYGAREWEQAWMDFALKGTNAIHNAINPTDVRGHFNIGGSFKNDWDYYNRGVGKMANMFMGKLLMEETRSEPSEMERIAKELMETYSKEDPTTHQLSPADQQRANEALDRLCNIVDTRTDREVAPEEQKWLESAVKNCVQRLIDQGKITENQRAQYEQNFTNLLQKAVKIIYKREEKQNLTPEDHERLMKLVDFPSTRGPRRSNNEENEIEEMLIEEAANE